MGEAKRAAEGKRTIVETPMGTTIQIMPGDEIPEGCKVVGSEPLELTERVREPKPDRGPGGAEVRTAVVQEPKPRAARKSKPRAPRKSKPKKG